MAPALAQAAKILEPDVRLVKVKTEKEQALGARIGIQSLLTMIILSGGHDVARQSEPSVRRTSCVGSAHIRIGESNRARHVAILASYELHSMARNATTPPFVLSHVSSP